MERNHPCRMHPHPAPFGSRNSPDPNGFGTTMFWRTRAYQAFKPYRCGRLIQFQTRFLAGSGMKLRLGGRAGPGPLILFVGNSICSRKVYRDILGPSPSLDNLAAVVAACNNQGPAEAPSPSSTLRMVDGPCYPA